MKRQIKNLKSKGIDIEKGLYYCSGNESLYQEILDTVLEEGGEKKELIKQYAATRDTKHYYLEVHALKNIAATIGATELMEMAAKHCEAIKKGNDALMKEEAEILLNKYEEILDIIKE